MSEEKELKDEKENDDKTTDGDDKSKSATIGDVERIVTSAVDSIKSLIPNIGGDKSSGDGGADSGGEDDKSDRKGRTSGRMSLRDVEEAASTAVLKAIKEAGLDQVLKGENKEKEGVKPPNENKGPSKPRRLSSFMLGKGYLDEANK